MMLFGKDLSRDVAVIAEVGVNHEGDVEAASKMLRLAAEAGADAVKLQTYTPAHFVTTSNAERFARVTKFALSREDHLRLRDEAAGLEIALFSSAISEDVTEFIATLGPAVKIASGDLNFRPVIDAAMATGKTVILSTGNGTVEEIDAAVGWCREAAGSDDLSDRLVLLHCVSAYPAPMEQLNLLTIPFLRQKYGLTTGFSNHALEAGAVLGAVVLGAQVVEVHFTDRRTGRTFHDHALSFEPDELKRLVADIKNMRSARGQDGRPVLPCEVQALPLMRKGLVAARDLAAGTVLSATDLGYARPATEFQWSERERVVGRKLVAPLREGELVTRVSVGMGQFE